MAMPTPQDAAARWASRLAGSTDRIQAGVQSVTTSPGAAAARQADLWLQKLNASKAKFQANTGRVSTAAWQEATISKGLPRIASGATAAQPKMETFLSKFLPHMQNVVNGLPPRGTIDQNIQRAVAVMKGAATFKNQ